MKLEKISELTIKGRWKKNGNIHKFIVSRNYSDLDVISNDLDGEMELESSQGIKNILKFAKRKLGDVELSSWGPVGAKDIEFEFTEI